MTGAMVNQKAILVHYTTLYYAIPHYAILGFNLCGLCLNVCWFILRAYIMFNWPF